jgi:hypothetical protein
LFLTPISPQVLPPLVKWVSAAAAEALVSPHAGEVFNRSSYT